MVIQLKALPVGKTKKSKNKKVYVSYGYKSYASWLPGFETTNKIEEANLLLLAGGEDISPSLYNEKTDRVYFNKTRDIEEMKDYRFAQDNNIPIFGTCRGMQMITALEGGKLIYDMSHNGGHMINTFDGKQLRVNSLHHQMCNPFPLSEKEYKVLGWCKRGTSRYYYNGMDKPILNLPTNFVEPEILWFPQADALGTQWHPEMMLRNSDAVRYMQNIFILFMAGDLEDYYNKNLNLEPVKEKEEDEEDSEWSRYEQMFI